MNCDDVKIGYIGVGNMGNALARRLLLKHPVVIYDKDREALSSLVECGAIAASSVSDLAGQVDIVFICLPTSEHVHAVTLGEGGLASVSRKGMVVIDQTTGDPILSRKIHVELAQHGILYVDAPVSGGITGAEEGTIAIMVGAESDEFEAVKPILDDISSRVIHAGPIGTGHVAKLANNTLSACCRLASLEALTLAVKNGMKPERALEIILASSGSNFWLQAWGQKVVSGDYSTAFTLRLSHKDVKHACQLASASGVPYVLGDSARNLYQIAASLLGDDIQVNAVARHMEMAAGVSLVRGSRSGIQR